MKSIRLWYKKSGLAIYTSHLDLNRCFTRAVRRANIPLWYTEGFNPHPYMTFLMPLPLGQTGMREPIDMRIEDDEMSHKTVMEKLNAVLPQGLEIVDVTRPVNKANEIFSAEYIVDMEFPDELQAEAFAYGANDIISGGELNAEKKSKRGIKTVNLCEMVRSFECKNNGKAVSITTVLAAGTALNLNADLLINSLLDAFSTSAEKLDIVRTKLLLENSEIFE